MTIDDWIDFYLEAEPKYFTLGGYVMLADPANGGKELGEAYTYTRSGWVGDHVVNFIYNKTAEYIDKTEEVRPTKVLQLRTITADDDDYDDFGLTSFEAGLPNCILLAFAVKDPKIYFVKTDLPELPVFCIDSANEFSKIGNLADFKAMLAPCDNLPLAEAQYDYGWDTSEAGL